MFQLHKRNQNKAAVPIGNSIIFALVCICTVLYVGQWACVRRTFLCPFVGSVDSWHSESQSWQMTSRPWCHSLSTTPEEKVCVCMCVCLCINLSELFCAQMWHISKYLWALFIISISPSCSSPAPLWHWPVQQHWVSLNCWDERTDGMQTEKEGENERQKDRESMVKV